MAQSPILELHFWNQKLAAEKHEEPIYEFWMDFSINLKFHFELEYQNIYRSFSKVFNAY